MRGLAELSASWLLACYIAELFVCLGAAALFIRLAFFRKAKGWLAVTFFLYLAAALFNQGFADLLLSRERQEVRGIAVLFSEFPLSLYLFFMLGHFAFELVLWWKLRRILRDEIEADSIKESLDALPAGVCFDAEDGTLLLANRQMLRIASELLGKTALNGRECFENIRQGRLLPGNQLLRSEPTLVVKTPERVWGIRRQQIGDFREVIACDISYEHALYLEIQKRKKRLEDVNRRLKKYNNRIEMTSWEKAILQVKIQVHDDIGRSLTALYAYLKKTETTVIEREKLLDLWNKELHFMRWELEHEREMNSWERLSLAADSIGVRIWMDGKLPEKRANQRLLIDLIHEALNNAVRHADAKKLWIHVSEEEHAYIVKIYNDGRVPEAPVEEKGGLRNLRRAVENAGGWMRVESQPRFAILAELLKGGSPHVED